MALSGVIIPPTAIQPVIGGGGVGVSPVAVNMALDLPPPAVVKPEPVPMIGELHLQEQYKLSASPKAVEEQKSQQEQQIKEEEAMEVDEPKEEPKVEVPSNGLEPGEIVPGHSAEDDNRSKEQKEQDEEDENQSLENQQKKNNLMENEYNAESRCSTGSQEDMWRPW